MEQKLIMVDINAMRDSLFKPHMVLHRFPIILLYFGRVAKKMYTVSYDDFFYSNCKKDQQYTKVCERV